MIIHKNKLYEWKTNTVFEGHFPLKEKLEEAKRLELNWIGEPIPFFLWADILAFFRAGYEKTKAEQMVRLYYQIMALYLII